MPADCSMSPVTVHNRYVSLGCASTDTLRDNHVSLSSELHCVTHLVISHGFAI